MARTKYTPEADVWHDVCPWCGGYEDLQVGTERAWSVDLWCRTCSGWSRLMRHPDGLQRLRPPRARMDKRRPVKVHADDDAVQNVG